MSYCVNCGVELDDSAKNCPLCGTPVINPAELEKIREAQSPFPTKKGQVEAVKRKDLGILLTVMMLATAAICAALNRLVFKDSLWSLVVLGSCVMLWVIMVPFVINTKQSVYLSLLYDGASVVFLLYMIKLLVENDSWFAGLGLPLTVLVTAVIELFVFCVDRLPKSFLTVTLYLFTGIGILCLGIEILIDMYAVGGIALGWSAVVLTVCGVFDIAIITMLSRRRLRNSVQRRLHF